MLQRLPPRVRSRLRENRILLWALIVSLFVHFTLGPLLTWLFGQRFAFLQPQPPPQPQYVVTSAAIRLERRTRPVPPKPRVAVRRPVSPVRPQPKTVAVRPAPQQPTASPEPKQTPRRREIARIDEHARISQPPSPQPTSRSANTPSQLTPQMIAEQERQFAQTIEQLRHSSDPVVSSERTVEHSSTTKRYGINVPGAQGELRVGEGILTPVQRWVDQGYVYYYVHYDVVYPDGTEENGNVPWPIRYAPRDDPFRTEYDPHIPLPGPLPDYTLPAGTELHPLVKYCFERRLEYCPIQRD